MAFPVHFTIDAAFGAGVGFVVGAFTPAVGRKIKQGFVALAKKVVAAGEAEIAKAAKDVAAKV
jgi:hypothetical protein